jgi:hypothetical protein
MHTLDLVSPFRSDGEPIAHVDAPDPLNPILGLDLPHRLD